MTYPATANDHYYVAAQDGRRTALVLGPYPNHGEAAKHIDRARIHCSRAFRDTAFSTWGVLHLNTAGKPRQGKLNATLGTVAP